MNTTNHMATGALIAVSVREPALVVPLAFLSHLAIDTIPHFGYKKESLSQFFKHRLTHFAMVIDFIGLITLFFFILEPNYLVYLAAFIALTPDFVWHIRYFFFERTGKIKLGEKMDPFTKFHAKIQWFEKPIGLAVEVVFSILLLSLLFYLK